MKAQRPIFVTVLVGMALILLGALSFWRSGVSVPSGRIVDTESRNGASSAAESSYLQKGVQRARFHRVQPPSARATTGTERTTPSVLRTLMATLQSIRTEPDVLIQEKKLESLAGEISPADLPTAVEFLTAQNSSKPDRDFGLRLIRRWAENDPQAAADCVGRSPSGAVRQDAINGVAIVWANQNLTDAVGWVRQLPADGERETGLTKVAYEAARTQPMEALRLAAELPANEMRNDLMTHTAGQWATTDPEAATEWAGRIADGALRERVITEIATTLGESNPLAAATLAVKSLASGKQQDDAIVGIVQRWVQKAPEEAAAWVAEFPEGTLRETALEALVKHWADQDLERAGSWLSSLGSGSSHDVAVGAYVSQIAPRFPELAARWAKAIEDESMRHREMEMLGEAWMGSDAPAARVWITQASLPETTKTRLLALGSK